jgi:hypothetical protein
MRKDFKIALLCALSAIPLGIAMSVAPDYISALKVHPALSFWGGIVVTALLLTAAAIIAIRGEQLVERAPGAKKRMVPFVGMIFSGICFMGFAAWYIWPTKGEQIPPPEANFFVQYNISHLPREIPSTGSLKVFPISSDNIRSGTSIANYTTFRGEVGSTLDWTSYTYRGAINVYQCEIISDAGEPLIDVNIPLDITIRQDIPDRLHPGQMIVGDIIKSGVWFVQFARIDSGPANSSVLYLVNKIPNSVYVSIPEFGSARTIDGNEVRLRLVRSGSVMSQVPMRFAPFKPPQAASQ